MALSAALFISGCSSLGPPQPPSDSTDQAAGDSGTGGGAGQPAGVPTQGGESSASAEAKAESAESGFRLGEGDLVRFTMFGQPDMETSTYVSADGRISLPLIGALDVGGLSPTEAGKRATDAYSSGGYFVDPQVNLTVEQYRSRQISVLGEVNEPGRYPLDTQTTVLDALALSGGVTPEGAAEVTVIRRSGSGKERFNVNLNNAVASGEGEIALIAGDVVFVPEAARFYIYGQVQQPNAYPLRAGMTIQQAISVGGGVTERGSSSRVELRRRDESGELQNYDPDLTDKVQPDDVIFVKERFF